MSKIKPFRALRPTAEKARYVACAPYDVVSDVEVRQFIREVPISFLRITRADAEFPPGETPSPETIYQRAGDNLRRLVDEGTLTLEDEPALYIYRLSGDSHEQIGVVACCSLDEYERGLIKKHEETRPDKVADRTRHLLATRAQTGLIFLAFRGTAEIHRLLDHAVTGVPLYDFFGADGVRHTVWRISDTDELITAFGDVPALYIADGHHRLESADLARRELLQRNPDHTGNEDYNYVVAGMFPAEDLKILAYNRAVTDLGSISFEDLMKQIGESFVVTKTEQKEPERHGEICMYTADGWHHLRFSVNYFCEPGPIERLDVSILQDFILGPVLGITDPRTDKRLRFVGAKKGIDELERLVDEGEAIVAFSLFPTTMDDLLAVSDMGGIMPPKSTWFEPKLKDGLIIHQI